MSRTQRNRNISRMCRSPSYDTKWTPRSRWLKYRSSARFKLLPSHGSAANVSWCLRRKVILQQCTNVRGICCVRPPAIFNLYIIGERKKAQKLQQQQQHPNRKQNRICERATLQLYSYKLVPESFYHLVRRLCVVVAAAARYHFHVKEFLFRKLHVCLRMHNESKIVPLHSKSHRLVAGHVECALITFAVAIVTIRW